MKTLHHWLRRTSRLLHAAASLWTADRDLGMLMVRR